MPQRPGRLQMKSALALSIGNHEGAGVGHPARHEDQRKDRQHEGQHQEELVRHHRSGQLLQAQLIGIESPEKDRAEQGLAWVKPTLECYVSHEALAGLVRLPTEPAPLSTAELARLDESGLHASREAELRAEGLWDDETDGAAESSPETKA
mgnify:CR=1 FL=1